MERRGHTAVQPHPDTDLAARPLLDLASGYIQRSIGAFPQQCERAPWRIRQNYMLDSLTTLRADPDRTLVGTRGCGERVGGGEEPAEAAI
ncbi:hypothetical protein [Nocardia brevicatena]|uniref:hypothetical protein n=1 Tax=Nocardia brevicatena TaxID=37327 RepID=UPI00030D6D52|nr:hypothetical protein [Nocardia brevicatena]